MNDTNTMERKEKINDKKKERRGSIKIIPVQVQILPVMNNSF